MVWQIELWLQVAARRSRYTLISKKTVCLNMYKGCDGTGADQCRNVELGPGAGRA